MSAKRYTARLRTRFSLFLLSSVCLLLTAGHSQDAGNQLIGLPIYNSHDQLATEYSGEERIVPEITRMVMTGPQP